MNVISRRSFIRSGGAAALGLALGSMVSVPGFLRRALADESGITWNGKKLLFLFLRGGNDAINTIIPAGDNAYGPSVRPTLAIPQPSFLTSGGQAPTQPNPNEAIDLGNGFATMHPSLADMVPVYNSGQLAMIHRVGYPHQSRSHFNSGRYWETGIPNNDLIEEGVLYRTVVETGLHQTQMLPAVSINRTLPLLVKGDIPLANISNPQRFDLLGVYAAARQKHIEAIRRIHKLPYPLTDNRDATFPSGQRFVDLIDQIAGIDFDDNDSENFIDVDGMTHLFPIDVESDEKEFDNNFAYNFFRSLKYTAQILTETDAVISGTEMVGFDTHNEQGGDNGGMDGTHANLLQRVGWAIYALKQYFTALGQWDNTVVLTLTEFGRTTIENNSYGTDHAEAGVMFAAGGGINGGVYQCDGNDPILPWATGMDGAMFHTDGRYLSRTVDYRSVLGEIIRAHLGATDAQLDKIIPGYANPAESLRAGGLSIDGQPVAGELGLV